MEESAPSARSIAAADHETASVIPGGPSFRGRQNVYLGARAHSVDDVKFLARAGFDFAEVDWKDPHAVRAEVSELATLQEKYGIAYLAHGPSERNPFDIAEIVEVMGPTVRELLKLASKVEIALYTQHLWLDPRFVNEEAIEQKQNLLERWVEEARRGGVTLCIENLSETAEHMAPAFGQVPELCMTLDVGHGEILSQPNASFGFIGSFADRIRHVHLHDNNGGSDVSDDLHLPIGEGCIDFAAILGELCAKGYEGGFSLEVALEHVKRSREVLRGILKDHRGVAKGGGN